MKKKIVVTGLAIFVIASSLFLQNENSRSQSAAKYVGVNTCVGACHKTEGQGKKP